MKAPRRHHSVNPHDQGGLFLKLYNALSIPSAPNAKPKTGFLFSILYTAAVTIPLVITLVYWFVLRASNPDRAPSTLLHLISFAAGDSAQVSATTSIHIASLGVKAISTFSSINMSVLNSVIALFEILVLSSVRKQKVLYIFLVSQVTPNYHAASCHSCWQHSGNFYSVHRMDWNRLFDQRQLCLHVSRSELCRMEIINLQYHNDGVIDDDNFLLPTKPP